MSEEFSATKLVKSPFTILFWVKTIMFGMGFVFLVFVGYGVYKAYFKKPEPTQNQTFIVQPGGNVKVEAPKSAPSKRMWYYLFVEPFIDQRSDSDMQTGIRGGLGARWEF